MKWRGRPKSKNIIDRRGEVYVDPIADLLRHVDEQVEIERQERENRSTGYPPPRAMQMPAVGGRDTMARAPVVIAGPRNRGRPVAALENDPRHFTGADIEELTYTLLGEARSEGPIGMLAVANVIRNRADSGFYPRDPVHVVRWDTQPWQFTTNGPESIGGNQRTTRAEVRPGSPLYQQAERIVRQAIVADVPTVPDITGRAINYHANYVSPNWSAGATTRWGTVTIGDHIFYARQPVPPLDIPTVASLLDVAPPPPPTPMSRSIAVRLRGGDKTPGRRIAEMREEQRVQGYRRSFASYALDVAPSGDPERRTRRPLTAYERAKEELRRRLIEPTPDFSFDPFSPLPGEMRAPSRTVAPGAGLSREQQEAMREVRSTAAARLSAPGANLTASQRLAMIRNDRNVTVAFELADQGRRALPVAQGTALPVPQETIVATEPARSMREPVNPMGPLRLPASWWLTPSTAPTGGSNRGRPVLQAAPTELITHKRKLYAIDADGNPIIVDAPVSRPTRVMREPVNPPSARLAIIRANAAASRAAAARRKAAQPQGPTGRGGRRGTGFPSAADPRQPSGSIIRKREAARLYEAPGLPIRPDLQPSGGIGVMPDHIAHYLRQQQPGTASVSDFVDLPSAPVPAIPSAAIVRQRTKVVPPPRPRPSPSTGVGTMPNLSDLIEFRSVPYGGRSNREMLGGTEYEELGGLLDNFKLPSAPSPAPASQRPSELRSPMREPYNPAAISPFAPSPAPAEQRPAKVTTQTVAPQPRTMTKTIRVRNPDWKPKQIVPNVGRDQIVRLDKYGVPTGEIGVVASPLPPGPNVPEFIEKQITVDNPNYIEITVPGHPPAKPKVMAPKPAPPRPVAPQPAPISRRPAVAIPKKSVSVYYAPKGSNTIYTNPTKYGTTSEERRARARRRQRLENFGGGEGSSGGFDGSGGSGSLVG